MKFAHIKTFGGRGERSDAFRVRLNGIAIDAQDRLLACGDREIKRFLPDGTVEARLPLPDVGWSITVAGGSIWVGIRGQLVQLNSQGNIQSRIEDARFGRITALAVQGETLFAADATHRTIHRVRDGRWQQEVGQDVNTRGFMLPNGVLDLALDGTGGETQTVVVAHPQKHRVERYDLSGRLMAKFGRFGISAPGDFGGCCNPTNIAVTPQGWLAVSEKAPPRVKIYTADGQFLAQSAEDVFDPNAKNIDLAADHGHRLYATDPYRCTIEVFELSVPSS